MEKLGTVSTVLLRLLDLRDGVIHQAFHDAGCHPFNNMFEDKSRHDCDSDDIPSC